MLKAPFKKGYNWYPLGKVKLGKESFFYFSRAWTLQVGMDDPYLDGKEVEVFVRLKFTGPKFLPDSKEKKSFTYVDRIIMVEPVAP